VLGEWTADRQLARFRADPANRGKTCRAGLWRSSRHPNYFFQSLFWWTFVLLSVGAPHAWLTLISPLIILFLILKVTGIPPTEERALQSRGEDYRAYQRTTSAFIPWFPRRDPQASGVKP
jgi:steroid 5-alpha reductase family enzyme